mmetsp:Transcript_96444/g.267977  ORF Transcript_96444/g.267977 Transcript_96444/m.267977 type:complete len:242 (-) Transcript_96444:1108-1833(-)
MIPDILPTAQLASQDAPPLFEGARKGARTCRGRRRPVGDCACVALVISAPCRCMVRCATLRTCLVGLPLGRRRARCLGLPWARPPGLPSLPPCTRRARRCSPGCGRSGIGAGVHTQTLLDLRRVPRQVVDGPRRLRQVHEAAKRPSIDLSSVPLVRVGEARLLGPKGGRLQGLRAAVLGPRSCRGRCQRPSGTAMGRLRMPRSCSPDVSGRPGAPTPAGRPGGLWPLAHVRRLAVHHYAGR